MTKDPILYRILVVEDNTGDFVLIEEYLEEYMIDTHLERATTLQEATNRLVQEPGFDIILLDLSLPDAGGEQLIDSILRISGSTPVIALTGFTDMAFSVRSVSLGISDYLLKDELSALALYKSIRYNIERSRHMRQLTLSEKRYSDLFHFSPQPMWVYDAESLGFLDVNQAAILQYGYTREEFLHMTLEKLQQGVTKPRLSPLKPEQFHDNYAGIFTHRKKDGTTIQVEIRSNTIDFKGRKAGLILASDITQNLAYIETIEQQNARLQEIAWTQSHVVRAPLARMMGIIDLLQTTSCQDETVKDYLELLMESSREFDQIIREIVRKSEQLGKKPE